MSSLTINVDQYTSPNEVTYPKTYTFTDIQPDWMTQSGSEVTINIPDSETLAKVGNRFFTVDVQIHDTNNNVTTQQWQIDIVGGTPSYSLPITSGQEFHVYAKEHQEVQIDKLVFNNNFQYAYTYKIVWSD